MKTIAGLVAGVSIVLGGAPDQPALRPRVDDALPAYQKRESISGKLACAGAAKALQDGWAEEFERIYPGATVATAGGGSDAGIESLLGGMAQIAVTTRSMTAQEQGRFEQRYGHRPTPLKIGVDAVIVYVNAENPRTSLSIADIRRLFATDPGPATWGELGVEGEFGAKKVSRFGLGPESDSFAMFKTAALRDSNPSVQPRDGSSGVATSVGSEAGAVGFGGLYPTKRAKPVAVALREGEPGVAPTPENCISGAYPLAAPLLVYFNKPTDGRMDPLVGEFLTLVFSKQGQTVVSKNWALPLSAPMATEQARLLGG